MVGAVLFSSMVYAQNLRQTYWFGYLC